MSDIKFYDNLTVTGNISATGSIYGQGVNNTTPCAQDFVYKESYSNWINGRFDFGPGTDENKFYTLAQEYDNTDFLNLELKGCIINNKVISSCNSLTSIRVDYTNVAMRDDGYGLWYVNYTDYINSIFSSNNLYTRLSSGNDTYYRTNFCKLDQFSFVFYETGQLNSSSIIPCYYLLESYKGYTILDDFNNISYPYYVGIPFENSNWNSSFLWT